MDQEKMEISMIENINQIEVLQGDIVFKDYETLKDQALKLADQIQNIEVNENNVKISKKLLAAVNNRIKQLEDRRISIKKMMLEPYVIFESQVKEIVNIVKDADEIVRQQVKELEEKEREQKEAALKEIFDKRISHYSFKDLFKFMDFLKPKHLNKTTSIQAAEKEMIEYLEKITRDINAIEKLPEAKAILSAYLETKDLASAMVQVQELERRKEQIEASETFGKTVSQAYYLISITAHSPKELKFLEMLLHENEIVYTIDKIGGNF